MYALRWFAVSLLLLVGAHRAQGETLDAGNVTVEFERSAYTFDRDDGVSIVPISPESVSVSTFLNGVELNFNDQMQLGDMATGESDPLIGLTGNFNAGFSFLPNPGFNITGYRVTLFGTYDIERPGSISVDANGIGSFSVTDFGNGTFSESFETAGPIAPALIGSISATALVDFVEVPIGTTLVYVGSDFVPDPNCVDPDPSTCPLIEIPIYQEVTQYGLQSDLGMAGVNLQGIRVEALSVPEPSSLAAVLIPSGLWLAGVRRRRCTG